MSNDWFFFLIPLGLGLIFATVGFHGIRRARRLRRTGAKAYGQIVRLDTSSGDSGTLYHPVAQWFTPDGRLHEHSAAMGKGIILNFRPGTTVLVHYDPDDPRRAAIDRYDGGGADWLFALLGTAVTLGTVVVFTLQVLS
ncbi:DUF3592 domain-containing protein [Nocardia sp. NPDC051832]|uniref:DUF3592 domain-containing protein n=1 Tax=Nocardia sp. NPDC051832 TaxID=3155673 RepID=UPI00343D51E8